jgi:hypothetical protein
VKVAFFTVSSNTFILSPIFTNLMSMLSFICKALYMFCDAEFEQLIAIPYMLKIPDLTFTTDFLLYGQATNADMTKSDNV